ncbi:carboxypeptidase-like regulatory domain-containing protein [Polyangium aurulentum]|uniref:carboxypeptidase-like regulatory domain-containing protein n=1 Tax=Polyangium aurulentum TaxID=2567896 RepID=UPI0010ADE5E0|nr:carboxypeptidase-like regulatory domain-containing protein [Polyangium aurulentum]UQA62638.1 carboxypeptidase-like regulatory domain-containing protein [Polyangium aurulentum]
MKRFPCSIFTLLAASALAGCIPIFGASEEVSNGCTTDADCAGGGVCAPVDAVMTCIATKVDLPGLILEVHPGMQDTLGQPTSHLVPFGDPGLVAEEPAGLMLEHDIRLPEIQLSDIELTINYDYKGCSPPDSKLPAEITFYRHAQHANLPSHIATATLMPDATKTYMATLPDGIYDMYVVPQPHEPGCEPPPPTFYSKRNFGQGGSVPLTMDKEPRTISGTISSPKGMDLTGWQVEVVEPKRGLVVSDTDVLEVEPLSLVVKYNVKYFWDWDKETSPILRLRPPVGEQGLRFFWEITALSPLDLSTADITLVDLDGEVRDVEGFVLDDDKLPVVGTVVFKSMQLSGSASANATFGMFVDTDGNGAFTTKLPPGKYQVTAYPTVDSRKAITTDPTPWEIDPMETGCFCGKTITVRDRSTVQGSVQLPNGAPLLSGTASVEPSPEPQLSYLLSRLAVAAPYAQTDSTSLFDGEFTLHADEGYVDLLVTPPPESRFPWLVRSQVKVNADQGSDLTTLELSYPALLQGLVRDASGELITNATVNAWLPVKVAGEESATAVVQIASTTTGSDGRYTLLVAPSISK